MDMERQPEIMPMENMLMEKGVRGESPPKGSGLSWGTVPHKGGTVLNRIDQHNKNVDAVRKMANLRGLETGYNRPITSILIGRDYHR